MQKSTLALILTATLLGGCATATFDKRACPREQQYSKQEQSQLADELDKAGPMTKRAIRDYGKLRDKTRACRN